MSWRREYHYAECHYAECRYAECHYAECHYAECHHAECRGALNMVPEKLVMTQQTFERMEKQNAYLKLLRHF
jgi:hypothetical protein